MNMHEEILKGLTNAIYAAFSEMFGDGLEIYTEAVPQGFETPSFAVMTVRADQEKRLHYQYDRHYVFDVLFFPTDTQNQNEQLRDVAEMMQLAIEYVDVGDDVVRGYNMHSETVDQVLHFGVSYDVRVMVRPDPDPIIRSATLNEHIR